MNFERLFFLREKCDIYQTDIAKILSVKQVNISNWETGKEIIPLPKLNDYANYFKVSIDYIVGISNDGSICSEYIIDKKIAGERLRKIRKDHHLTQEKLAKELNTTHSTISAYEHGKRLILTSFAYHICTKYNISMDWLCGRKM